MARPSKFITAARILLFSVLIAIGAGAVTMLISLIVLLLVSAVRHTTEDVSIAYRVFAPIAVVFTFLVALIMTSRFEIREYRRTREDPRYLRSSA